MPTTIHIDDLTLTGTRLTSAPWGADDSAPVTVLELASSRTTLRELIRLRVYEEIRQLQAAQPQRQVEPTDFESALNHHQPMRRLNLDWQAQAEHAIQAFHKQTYIVTVDDKQVEDLDTDLDLRPDSQVNFVKLTPMVGG